MNSAYLIPFFMLGLLSSGHCVGMCGGVVGALSVSHNKVIPIKSMAQVVLPRTLVYNLGRISSYVVAGAVAAGLVDGMRTLTGIAPWQSTAYILTNGMLIMLGLYLMNLGRGVTLLETIGQRLWKTIKPLTVLLLPIDTPIKLFFAGFIWGWLPCGLVYSVLVSAMLSGTTTSGVFIMLSFGLGTLPMLMAMGIAGAPLRQMLQIPSVRRISGAIVIGFGVMGLIRVGQGFSIDIFCV